MTISDGMPLVLHTMYVVLFDAAAFACCGMQTMHAYKDFKKIAACNYLSSWSFLVQKLWEKGLLWGATSLKLTPRDLNQGLGIS
eukprot:1138768-Pelagomonas_calceolata.AAC.1